MAEYAWTKQPVVEKCAQCDNWTLTGVTITGQEITLSLVAFTPATFAAWTVAGGRQVWCVVNGGVCRVRAGDGVPLGEWRAEHVCPRIAAPGEAQGLSGPSAGLGPAEGLGGRQNAAPGLHASPTPTPGASAPMPSAVPVSSTVTPVTVPPSESAEEILIRLLGAQIIEKEINGRLVYRKFRT